jgi:hypothetical protein
MTVASSEAREAFRMKPADNARTYAKEQLRFGS